MAGWLAVAMTRLPPTLGDTPTQPLEVGRTSRGVQPAQRTALAVRDGGCVFPGCARPLALVRRPSSPALAALARPTARTWPWCAGLIIGLCMRAGGG